MKKRIVIAAYSGEVLAFVTGAFADVENIDAVKLPRTIRSRDPHEGFDRVYRFNESSDNGMSRVARYVEVQ